MKNPEFEDTRISEINYSERNYELRIQALMPYLEMETPEETKRIVNGMIDDLKANHGKGFVKTESVA